MSNPTTNNQSRSTTESTDNAFDGPYSIDGEVLDPNSHQVRDLGRALLTIVDKLEQIADPRLAYLAEQKVTVVELVEEGCRHATYDRWNRIVYICSHLTDEQRSRMIDKALDVVRDRSGAAEAKRGDDDSLRISRLIRFAVRRPAPRGKEGKAPRWNTSQRAKSPRRSA
jgi:hypothetical protein